MKYAWLVLRNLSRNRRRTGLTILAIALAVFTYSTLASLPYLAAHLVSSPTAERRLVAMNKSGFFYPLPATYRRKIEAIPHVEAVTGLTYFGGIYRSPSDQIGIAVDAMRLVRCGRIGELPQSAPPCCKRRVPDAWWLPP